MFFDIFRYFFIRDFYYVGRMFWVLLRQGTAASVQ